MKKTLLSIIWLILISQILVGQNVEFSGYLDRNPVSAGERFTVTYSINADASNFKGPGFKGLNVLGGPMQSQSIQVINGKMTRSLSFSFVLSADKAGTYNIDPATIMVNGNTVKSNSLQIKVLPESDAQKQKKEQEQEQEKNLNQQALDILKKNIFVKAEVSKRTAYQGEQITATYKLYIHPQLNPIQMNPKKMPTFDGFWTQGLDIDKIVWQKEVINGVSFNSAVIKQVVLFPQRAGKLTADPYEFEFVVRLKVENNRRRSGGIFDDFFDSPFFSDSYRDFPYSAKSEAIPITVLNLPNNAPESFAGAVGNITMDAWLDKTKTKSGEPVSFKLKLSGSGNLKLLDAPKINFPPGFEVYDPKISDNTSVLSSGMSGNVIYEYLIIPRNPGTFKIEPVNFTYFDLNTKQYKTLTSSEFNIEVEKGSESSNGTLVTGVRKEEVELIGKDIRFIKLNLGEIKRYPKSCFNTYIFWILSVLPLFIFISIIIYRRKKLRDMQDLLQFKTRKATTLAKKRLSAARNYLKQNLNDKFYEEINRALWGYLSDKLKISYADLTKDKAREVLSLNNVNSDIVEKFLNTLDEAEFARFAPSASNKGMEVIYKDAVKVITDMEGVLK